MSHTDWLDRPVELARSVGGVYAFRNVSDGLVRGGVTPWPPPELVQKLYQSRQSRAYRDEHLSTVTAGHGYYTDLQSVHSEDAVTWNLFGPLAYAERSVRAGYASQLLTHLLEEDVPPTQTHIWLWRRLPHPDTLVSGGPEIDFGIQTDRALVLGEAKWRSSVGAAQGIGKNKDQIQLRIEFCVKYGAALFPGVQRFIILLIDQSGGAAPDPYEMLGTERVRARRMTWETAGGLEANPWREEFLAQLRWRQRHSRGPVPS